MIRAAPVNLAAAIPHRDVLVRAGVPAMRVSVFGDPGNWDAALMVNQIGNAQRRARFKSLVHDLRGEYDRKPG